MATRLIANRNLFKHLSLPVAVSAMLYGLHAFDGTNTHAAVLRTYHAFDSSVCERPTSIVVNPQGLPEAKGATKEGEACRLLED